MINHQVIIRIQLVSILKPTTRRMNLKKLISVADISRHLMRSYWIAKRNIKSWKLWSKRDGKLRWQKDSKHKLLCNQTLLKEFIKMLRNFNNLRNTRPKICNMCKEMPKIKTKAVSPGRDPPTFRQIERHGTLVHTPQAHMWFLPKVVKKVQACRISKFWPSRKVQKGLLRKQDAWAHHTRAQRITRRLATTNALVLQRLQSSLWATSGWTRRRLGWCNQNPTVEVDKKLDFVLLPQELPELNSMQPTVKQSVITCRVIIQSKFRDEMSIRLDWTMISK